MAKRTSRSEADDGATATPKPRSARTRTRATADAPVSGGGAPSIATTQAARPSPEDTRPPEDAIAADPAVLEANHDDQQPTEDEIRERAYTLYVERGGAHGKHEDDWFRAEQELRNRRNSK